MTPRSKAWRSRYDPKHYAPRATVELFASGTELQQRADELRNQSKRVAS